MRTAQRHAWINTTLEDDYIPGIPVWVTRCVCGAIAPESHRPESHRAETVEPAA